MKLNIKELLDFFDDKKNSQKGDANAIMATLGEDLNACAYKHFRGNKVEILEKSVSQNLKKEKRLDRWIVDKKNKKLFQCEIKNFAATAIGGRKLKSDAGDKETRGVVEYHWNRELEGEGSLSKNSKNPHPNSVSKVLLKMYKPEKYEKSKVEPLLIYWMPISSDKNGLEPLSIIPVKKLFYLPMVTEFSKLQIFSVSLYLRQLYKKGKGQKIIDLDMPHFEHRMKILTRFQNKK